MKDSKNTVSRFPREREELFHSYNDFANAPPISFAIDGFLQNGGATLIAGLSGHGKTIIMLSLAKALLSNHTKKLWNHFDVRDTASRVVYLIPESGIAPFKHRLRLFHLYRYVKDRRLLVRTLSKGPTPPLDDPQILAAAKGAHVFLDTAIRFREGNENDASDNQELANRIFDLLRAGACTVVAAQHSPKTFAKETTMTLENMVRGSTDIGAMVATAWGIKQLDHRQNIIHIQNIKPRDFEPCGPFQIIGRPYIDNEGHFLIYKKPGECGFLADEQKCNKGGAPIEKQKQRVKNKQQLREWLREDPNATAKALAKRFKQEARIALKLSTIRRYRSEINKEGS